jgi:hypothetical protein
MNRVLDLQLMNLSQDADRGPNVMDSTCSYVDCCNTKIGQPQDAPQYVAV